jgi:hypothetical protein
MDRELCAYELCDGEDTVIDVADDETFRLMRVSFARLEQTWQGRTVLRTRASGRRGSVAAGAPVTLAVLDLSKGASMQMDVSLRRGDVLRADFAVVVLGKHPTLHAVGHVLKRRAPAPAAKAAGGGHKTGGGSGKAGGGGGKAGGVNSSDRDELLDSDEEEAFEEARAAAAAGGKMSE